MQTIKLELTPQAFNVVMGGLEELPHKVSRGVIDDLVRQVQAQQQTPAAEAPAEQPAEETLPTDAA